MPDHVREPCPDRILDDLGRAFSMGAVKGFIVVNAPLEYIASDLGFPGNVITEGLVVSMFLIGSFFGCVLSASIANALGRRRSLQATAVPMIIGCFLSAMSPNYLVMLVGRFIVGIGVGAAGPVATLYVTEISPAHVRGTYGSLLQIAACFGILGALFIGIPSKNISGWWRACFWVAGIPAALIALGMELCEGSCDSFSLFMFFVFTEREEWTNLCNALATTLTLAGNTLVEALCYICTGNIDKTVEI